MSIISMNRPYAPSVIISLLKNNQSIFSKETSITKCLFSGVLYSSSRKACSVPYAISNATAGKVSPCADVVLEEFFSDNREPLAQGSPIHAEIADDYAGNTAVGKIIPLERLKSFM
ncbi:MAG: hypothetical protein ABSA46_18750 [Thermodesulfovibrionales bacterium]